MTADELIAITKLNAQIEDTSVDYPSTAILLELNNALTTKFERLVVDAKAGYWLQNTVYTTTTAIPALRMPSRACGLSKIEISNGNSGDPTYRRLVQVREGHADLFSGPQSNLGNPQKWVARGDKIVMLPTPDNTGYLVRVWYYIRPSRLIPTQTAGLITAVNATARTIVVNSIPSAISASGTSAVLTSAVQRIDVVSPSGWHEAQIVSAPQTYTGTTFTVGGTQDMTTIQVGDYVRAEDQSEWPTLPADFHRCIADVATVKILIQQDFQNKAGGFAQDVGADLGRFSQLISTRVMEEPQTVRAELPSLRRRW